MILDVIDPPDCDAQGVPLDWKQCRTCEGCGKLAIDGEGPFCCPKCDGHGSLRAAALAGRLDLLAYFERKRLAAGMIGMEADVIASRPGVRCEGCGHPMSAGTWEDPDGVPPVPKIAVHDAFVALRQGREPVAMHGVHFSPCDERCRHGGPGRWKEGEHPNHGWKPADEIVATEGGILMVRNGQLVEASWRPVDVRTLGWPHDLRPEKLAVLCLRCWAARAPRQR